MPSGRSSTRGTWVRGIFVAVVTAVVAAVWISQGSSLWDRRPSYVSPHTAAELRERPDLTEVLPDHVEATRALLEAVGRTASVTWDSADAQVFVHQRDGVDEQVVDGYPALRWDPESWYSVGSAALDDASIEELAQTFRDVLEPRGYEVSTNNRSVRNNRHAITFSAIDAHGAALELFDSNTDGELYVMSRTGVHLYRDETCDPDPLACFPTVKDPAAGL